MSDVKGFYAIWGQQTLERGWYIHLCQKASPYEETYCRPSVPLRIDFNPPLVGVHFLTFSRKIKKRKNDDFNKCCRPCCFDVVECLGWHHRFQHHFEKDVEMKRNEWEIREIKEYIDALERAKAEKDVDEYNQAIMHITDNASNLNVVDDIEEVV